MTRSGADLRSTPGSHMAVSRLHTTRPLVTFLHQTGMLYMSGGIYAYPLAKRTFKLGRDKYPADGFRGRRSARCALGKRSPHPPQIRRTARFRSSTGTRMRASRRYTWHALINEGYGGHRSEDSFVAGANGTLRSPPWLDVSADQPISRRCPESGSLGGRRAAARGSDGANWLEPPCRTAQRHRRISRIRRRPRSPVTNDVAAL
jgi:hypothetical protein